MREDKKIVERRETPIFVRKLCACSSNINGFSISGRG